MWLAQFGQGGQRGPPVFQPLWLAAAERPHCRRDESRLNPIRQQFDAYNDGMFRNGMRRRRSASNVERPLVDVFVNNVFRSLTMHALRCTVMAAMLLLFAAALATARDQQANDQTQPRDNSQNALAGQTQFANAPAPLPNTGRYRHHNGRWWYWMPDNRWVVWQRNTWVPYSSGMFARQSSSANRVGSSMGRRYSYQPQPEVYYPNYGWRLQGYSRGVRSAGSKVRGDYLPE
jgi:hypothetical protein